MSTPSTETKKPIGKAGLDEVSKSQELKDLGWRTEHLESGFHAYEINGDRKIGPASSIKALHTQVMLASGPVTNGKTVKAGSSKLEGGEFTENEHRSTEQRLPTMEEPEIDELNRLGDDCIFAKEKRDKAKMEFDDSCDVMREKMREHGRKRYNRRGFSLVIEDTEKLVIKKAEQSPPKHPRTPKKTASIV